MSQNRNTSSRVLGSVKTFERVVMRTTPLKTCGAIP
jgi:hypothetical protein